MTEYKKKYSGKYKAIFSYFSSPKQFRILQCLAAQTTVQSPLPICLSVRPSVCSSVCLSVRSSICPSIHLSIHWSISAGPSVCRFVWMSVCPSLCLCKSGCLSGHPSVNPSGSSSICFSISLSVHPSVCVSICLSLSQPFYTPDESQSYYGMACFVRPSVCLSVRPSVNIWLSTGVTICRINFNFTDIMHLIYIMLAACMFSGDKIKVQGHKGRLDFFGVQSMAPFLFDGFALYLAQIQFMRWQWFIHYFHVNRSRWHWSFKIFVMSAPWFYVYLLRSATTIISLYQIGNCVILLGFSCICQPTFSKFFSTMDVFQDVLFHIFPVLPRCVHRHIQVILRDSII